MSGVFQNIDPPPPSPPCDFGAGGGHTRWMKRGWGLIFWKTSDTALYSIYVSTLCTHFHFYFNCPNCFLSPGNHSCWQTRTWSQASNSPQNSSWIRRSSSYWLQPARNPPRNSCEDYSGQKDPGRDTAFSCASMLSEERKQFCF